jgi:hypothetical protein
MPKGEMAVLKRIIEILQQEGTEIVLRRLKP